MGCRKNSRITLSLVFPVKGKETESINEKEPSVMASNGQTNWDKGVDVIVVGYGAAGGMSAITAHAAAVVGLCSN
jgi:hypothetical protein